MNLVIVSHRLPYAVTRGDGGEWRVERGTGGLVTAWRPVRRRRGGKWIGALDGKPSGRHGQRPED